ncbi:MAG: aldo/keto reductase [Tannerellaceae bacterium]|jgi:aryl-alcohol dehydrogenase-like predicted oxidoreductase|nr:aldo/keto reductase [Tannerellaceae bacterium]
MKHINRRTFIRTGVTGLASLAAVAKAGTLSINPAPTVDTVKLGASGLTVSRIAMGTGSVGGNRSSNQTRLGMDNFVKLARHAYDAGIRFYDTADSYGSVPFVGQAIKGLPRENITLLTKVWTSPDDAQLRETVRETIDRLRREAGTDYYDIVLLHCLFQAGWTNDRKRFINELSKAKQEGIIKAVGVSCHSYDALVEASESPWVDVIMARINPFQSKMDGTPESINKVLAVAKQNGKGIIAMKVFGEGLNVSDSEREQSIRYILTEANAHCMTLGMETAAQMNDAATRVMKNVRS